MFYYVHLIVLLLLLNTAYSFINIKCYANKNIIIHNRKNSFLESSLQNFNLDSTYNDDFDSNYKIDKFTQNRVNKGSIPQFSIEGDSTEETLQQKVTVLTHFVVSAFSISIAINTFQTVPMNLVYLLPTIILSIILGDFATGVFHWAVDNYGNIKTPVFGSVCAAFQGHHETPWTITFRPFANNVYKIAYGTIPALLLLCVTNLSPYLRIFFTLFINWWLLSQEFHKYSHMRTVPPIPKFFQDNNIILSKKEHGLHHSSPYEGHYCILTGICNPILDKTNFFRYLEKLVYKLTGNKPNTWKIDPSLQNFNEKENSSE